MFEEILSRIGAGLLKHSLPYMIIGGQAVLLYGEPRLTRDIDIALGVNVDHLNDFLVVVQELSLKPIPVDIEDVKTIIPKNPGIDIQYIETGSKKSKPHLIERIF